MIFGKYINRYYLKNAPVLLLGLAVLLTVDYIQLLIPRLYRCLLYTSPSPRDKRQSRMPSSA